MIGIYAIVNVVNGKMYVGQSVSIYARLMDHKYRLLKHRHPNSYLQHAFDKYGLESFNFRSLCECTENQLDDMERSFIARYKTMDDRFGYNLETGGNLKKRPSKLTLQKMSESAKNRSEEYNQNMSKVKTGKKRKPFSAEWIQNLSKAHKGDPKTEEWKKKISESNKGKPKSKEARKKMSEARLMYFEKLRLQNIEVEQETK